MKSKFLAVLLSVLLSTGIITMTGFVAKAANDNVTLTFNPPTINKAPGDVNSFFDVFVEISLVTDLYGFDINITWNNNLITFDSYDTTFLGTIWPGGWFEAKNASDVGTFKLVAVSTSGGYINDPTPGTSRLFGVKFKMVKACNFALDTPIHFNIVKLSNSVWQTIPSTQTDGHYYMSATVPAIEFALVDPTPSKPFEYCKIFKVEVYARHICAQMTDFDLTVLFNSELLQFVDVDYWGVFGTGSFINTTGSVQVMGAGTLQTGDRLLLFALTFHIEFDGRAEHIWKAGALNELPAQISIKGDVGEFSFVEGTIPITGITLPAPLTVTVKLIRGDVSCDGKVNIDDLRSVAAYYDKKQGDPEWSLCSKYDLVVDNTIDIFDLVVVATNFWYGT